MFLAVFNTFLTCSSKVPICSFRKIAFPPIAITNFFFSNENCSIFCLLLLTTIFYYYLFTALQLLQQVLLQEVLGVLIRQIHKPLGHLLLMQSLRLLLRVYVLYY